MNVSEIFIRKPIATSLAAIVWGAASWRAVAIPAVLLLLILIAMGYRHVNVGSGVRVVAVVAKTIGIVILSLALLEPLFSVATLLGLGFDAEA